MTDKVTFGDLHQLLAGFGFEERKVEQPYVVFAHKASGAVQAFRAHRPKETVDPMTLAAVRMTLAGNGFLDPDEFESKVHDIVVERRAKTRRK
jgi:hypothetical protein